MRISRDLRSKLNDRFDIFTFDDANWSPIFVGSMNFLYVIAGFFVFLILGAVALTLVNTTTLNLLERTREIGTLRAIGYPPGRLKSLFRREAFILCCFCIAIGTVIAAVFSVFFNGLNIRFSPPGTQGDIQFMLLLNPWLCVLMGTLVFLITLFSTEFVVFKKAKQKIVLLLAETGA
jgi:putative ABC transport system permease protein